MNLGGSIATAGGVVFIGATNDARFRAFESRSGKVLWEATLEASAHTSPITYMGRDGRQYVAVMASGGGGFLGSQVSNSLVAFALPDVLRKPLPPSVTQRGNRPAPEAAGEPRPLPPGGAKALVEKTCGSGCHTMDAVNGQRLNEAQWNAMVRSMVARGAQASDAQVRVIVDYLTKTLGSGH